MLSSLAILPKPSIVMQLSSANHEAPEDRRYQGVTRRHDPRRTQGDERRPH